jgi:hypothetical protein
MSEAAVAADFAGKVRNLMGDARGAKDLDALKGVFVRFMEMCVQYAEALARERER